MKWWIYAALGCLVFFAASCGLFDTIATVAGDPDVQAQADKVVTAVGTMSPAAIVGSFLGLLASIGNVLERSKRSSTNKQLFTKVEALQQRLSRAEAKLDGS